MNDKTVSIQIPFECITNPDKTISYSNLNSDKILEMDFSQNADEVKKYIIE